MYVPTATINHRIPRSRVSMRFFVRRCFAEGRGKALMANNFDSASVLGVEHDYARTVLRVAAARLCALNILAQAETALRDLDRIVQLLRLNGFVNSAPDFTDYPKVINGASNLMVDVLGDKGRHTRIAVGCVSLPLGAAVEIDAVFAIA